MLWVRTKVPDRLEEGALYKARFFCRKHRAYAGVEPAPIRNVLYMHVFAVRAFDGATGRLRTCIARFKGLVLCQLSYGCVCRD